MTTSKTLTRSRDKRMVAGVLGGFADYFNLDPTWIRVFFVAIAVISAVAPCILLYFLLWIVIPNAEPKSHKLSHSAKDWFVDSTDRTTNKDDSHQS